MLQVALFSAFTEQIVRAVLVIHVLPCMLQETGVARVRTWQHGLVSDGQLQWDRQCLQLVQYVQQHGDAHVGYRDGDDLNLVRWAKKQRAAYREQSLPKHRCDAFCVC